MRATRRAADRSEARRFGARSVAAAVLALAALLAPAAPAWSATPVVSPFRVSTPDAHATTSHGQRAIVVRTLVIDGVRGSRQYVSCNGCRRLPGKIVKQRPSTDRVRYRHVNWIIRAGHGILVRLERRGSLGRFQRLGLRRSDAKALVFKASGCVGPRHKPTPCPKGTPQPLPETQVPVTPPPPPPAAAALRKVVTVDNRVTNGGAMREDATPVRLQTEARILCGTRGCNIAGTERSSGGQYDAATCQREGERTTNGNDSDAADDANPERFESTRYYGVRLADGTFGYVSEVWVRATDRGGLDLPDC
jgi:hypothetical protein